VPFSLTNDETLQSVPAALAIPGNSNFPEHIQEAAASIADRFLEKVTEANPDPKDPVYQKRWADYAPTADQELRLKLGDHWWHAAHIQAHHQAQSQK
jgi:pyruvate-formate lyase-activating enzyme